MARDILVADEPPTQEAGGFVVELLGDFAADAPPSLRVARDCDGIEDFLNDGQVLGPTLLGRSAALGPVGIVIRGLLRLVSPGGVGFSHFYRGFPAKQEFELVGTQRLAAFAKDAPDQEVDLLAK